MELELRNVTVSYSAAEKILDNLNLEVNKGLFLGITGKSGSGKTTLLETICGFHKPDMGQVLFNNQNIYESEFDTLSFRKKVQMVFQFPENQFFETEIRREVEFGIKNSCLSSEEIIRRVTETLQTVGLYDEEIDELSPFALSGGQKRRLALACALVLQPEILLLDEPFSGLDDSGQNQIIKILQDIKTKGTTILMVSHDPNVLCEIADRIIVMNDGRIIKNEIPPIVYSDKQFCSRLGIGQPDTITAANLLDVDLMNDLTYENFIKELAEKLLQKK